MWIARKFVPALPGTGVWWPRGSRTPEPESPRLRRGDFPFDARYTGSDGAASGQRSLFSPDTGGARCPPSNSRGDFSLLPGGLGFGRLACNVAFVRVAVASHGVRRRYRHFFLRRYPSIYDSQGREDSEADLSTTHPQAGEEPRLPAPDVHSCGPCDPSGPAPEGSPTPLRLAAGADAVVWRVSDRATFKALRRGAHRARSGPVNVAFTRQDVPAVPRVGYAVGRRVGRAVVRNRLRRRLRAVVGEVAGGLRPGAYLISASSDACELSYEELKKNVTRAMTTASRDPGA